MSTTNEHYDDPEDAKDEEELSDEDLEDASGGDSGCVPEDDPDDDPYEIDSPYF
jgi:hypothetical protein